MNPTQKQFSLNAERPESKFLSVSVQYQSIACVIGTNAFGDVLLPGGVGESGSQMLAIKKSLLTDYADTVKYPNGEPPKFTPVTVRGQDHVILDVDERDGIFYITVGDPTASE